MPISQCSICCDFGYAQAYVGGRVIRVYCICTAGDKRIEVVKQALREVGIDPEDSRYVYRRYEISKYG